MRSRRKKIGIQRRKKKRLEFIKYFGFFEKEEKKEKKEKDITGFFDDQFILIFRE